MEGEDRREGERERERETENADNFAQHPLEAGNFPTIGVAKTKLQRGLLSEKELQRPRVMTEKHTHTYRGRGRGERERERHERAASNHGHQGGEGRTFNRLPRKRSERQENTHTEVLLPLSGLLLKGHVLGEVGTWRLSIRNLEDLGDSGLHASSHVTHKVHAGVRRRG